VNGLVQTQVTANDPEDDFDVFGYNPTQEELYQLYSGSGDVIQVEAGGDFTVVLKETEPFGPGAEIIRASAAAVLPLSLIRCHRLSAFPISMQ
jgi:hypothetical protein